MPTASTARSSAQVGAKPSSDDSKSSGSLNLGTMAALLASVVNVVLFAVLGAQCLRRRRRRNCERDLDQVEDQQQQEEDDEQQQRVHSIEDEVQARTATDDTISIAGDYTMY